MSEATAKESKAPTSKAEQKKDQSELVVVEEDLFEDFKGDEGESTCA